MAESVAIPRNFLNRDCDRALLMALKRELGGGGAFDGMLVRAWLDFGNSRAKSRPVDKAADGEPEFCSDSCLLLEEFIGWPGPSGGFVRLARVAGFIHIVSSEHSGGYEMSLAGFAELNKAVACIQSKGGQATAVSRKYKAAGGAATELLEVRRRSGQGLDSETGLSAERVRNAATFIIHALMCLDAAHKPKASDLDPADIITADKFITEHSADDAKAVLLYLHRNRESGGLERKVSSLLDKLPAYLAAERSGG